MNRPKNQRPSTRMSLLVAPAITLATFSTMAMRLGRPRKSRFGAAVMPSKALKDKRVRKAVASAQEAMSTARGQVDLKSAQAAREDITRRIGTLVDTTRETLPPLTQEAAVIARDVAERLRVEGLARSSELGERIKTEVAPAARVWAQDALVEAEAILTAARDRAGDFTSTARKEYAPGISNRTSATAGLVAGTAVTAAQAFGKRVGEMSIPTPSKKSRRGLRRKRNRGGEAMRKAGVQTKHAMAETMTIFFWVAALTTVIYYALLTAEQRERFRAFLNGAATQIQDVVTDFQSSSDEEFGSTTV